MYSRATPDNFLLYKHSLCLSKLMDSPNTLEWVALNFNQIKTSRQTTFMATKNNRKKCVLNAFGNRAFILN